MPTSIRIEPAMVYEHEFDGGVDAAIVAPDADEQGHRDEHHFPEQEEEEEIERDEDADDSDFEHQEHDEEFFDAMVDAVPRSQNGDRREERRQDDQEQADAVDAEVIVNRRNRDPLVNSRRA